MNDRASLEFFHLTLKVALVINYLNQQDETLVYINFNVWNLYFVAIFLERGCILMVND